MKKIIFFIIIALILGISLFFIFKPKEENVEKTIPKQDTKVLEDQVINSIVLIENISITARNNKSTFSAKIKNLTGDILNYNNIQITITTKDDKITLTSYFGGFLDPEEEKPITAETNAKLENIKKIEFILT